MIDGALNPWINTTYWDSVQSTSHPQLYGAPSRQPPAQATDTAVAHRKNRDGFRSMRSLYSSPLGESGMLRGMVGDPQESWARWFGS